VNSPSEYDDSVRPPPKPSLVRRSGERSKVAESMRMRLDSVLGRELSTCLKSDRVLWWLVVGVVGVMISCWSLGVPYFSGPDEPLHASRAWSVVHGQVIGEEMNLGGFRLIEAPAWLGADRNDTSCYRFDPERPADCFSLESSNEIIQTRTQGAQLPLFYAVAGLPFRFFDGGLSLLLARIWAGILPAALIASTVVTARNSDFRLWLLPATLLSCTPMIFYIAGVMNPSGIEITSGLLLWVTSLAIFCDSKVCGRLFWRFAVAASLLILVRQLGPLWVLLIVGSCALLSERERLKDLLRTANFRIALLASASAGLLWAIWSYLLNPLAITQSEFAVDDSSVDILRLQMGRLWAVIQESVGVFGWLEVKFPFAVYLIWIFGVLFFIGLAVMFGSTKFAYASPLVLLGAIVIQTYGEFRTIGELGFIWQGRYSLPILVGVPLVAALGISKSDVKVKVSLLAKWMAGLLLWLALCLSYYQTERRYMVGSSGPLRIWEYGAWQPPVPVLFLLATFFLASALWILICAAATKYVGEPCSSDGKTFKMTTFSPQAKGSSANLPTSEDLGR
jgi:hypothetical protein